MLTFTATEDGSSRSRFTLTPLLRQPRPEFTLTPTDQGPGEDVGSPVEPKRKGFTLTPYASDGAGAVRSVFPGAQITSGHRTNNVGYANDDHHLTRGAVDLAPIKGMTFDQFTGKLKEAGYPIIQAIDEVRHPSGRSTGPHWHVSLGERKEKQFTLTPVGGPQSASNARRRGEAAQAEAIKSPQSAQELGRYSDTPKARNRAQRPSSPAVAPEKELGLGGAAWEGVKNIPGEAGRIAKDAWRDVRHPVEIVERLRPVVSQAAHHPLDTAGNMIEGWAEFLQGGAASLIDETPAGRFLARDDTEAERKFKRSIIKDPVGSAVQLIPAGRIAGKLGVAVKDAATLRNMSGAERAALRAERAAQAKQVTSAKNLFRTVLSRHDLDAQRAARQLESHQRVVGNAPVEHQREIIKAVESASSGGVQRLAEKYRPAALAIRNVAQRYRARIGEVLSSKGKEGPRFVEDYYARLWKQKPSEVRAAIAGQGSERNLKKRTIPTYEDGLAAGLTPVHENPLTGMAAYAQNMSRFLATHDLQNGLRREGLAKWVGEDRVPAGWEKLDGRGTSKMFADGEGKPRRLVLASPKPVARLWSRHLDPGLRATVEEKFGEGAGKVVAGAEKVSHVLGSTKLAFSAFHPVLIAGKGMASDMGNALRHFTRGAPADTVKALAHMPFAPVTTAAQGFRMGRRILSGDEAMSRLDKLYRDAGGRIGPADVYRSTLSPSFLQSAMRGTFTRDAKDAFAKVAEKGAPALRRFKAALDLGGRVMESWNDVVFRHYVPAMKRGAFERELATSLKAHPEWGPAEQLAEARRVLSSIDGRMGEISRDNLFWSRTAHQLGRMLLLSPSWQVGDVRVLEQAAGELPESLRGLLKGKGISQGPAQAAGLVGSFMLANAIGNYIYTGQAPKDLHDLKAFRTGGVNGNDGSPERAQAPSIMKDFFGFAIHPEQEITNKLHPALKTALEVYENRDWRNLPIVRPANARPDGSSRLHDALSYAGQSLSPIPFSENPNGPNSHLSALAQLAGLRPVGAEYTNPARYDATQQWLASKAWEDKKRADRKAAARKRVRAP